MSGMHGSTPSNDTTEGLLPPNWSSAKAPNGAIYYFNAVTGESTWTKPEFEDADAILPPPPPPPVSLISHFCFTLLGANAPFTFTGRGALARRVGGTYRPWNPKGILLL